MLLVHDNGITINFLPHCLSGISRKLNIVIAMDGSQLVDADTFKRIKTFAIGTLDAYEISRNKTLVSVLTFGNVSSINVGFESSVSKAFVKHVISTAERLGGPSNLASVVEFTLKGIFDKRERRDAASVLILIVAGSRQRLLDNNKLKMALEKLQRNNISVVVVAVGDIARSRELNKLVEDEKLAKVPSITRIKEALPLIVDASGKAAGRVFKLSFLVVELFVLRFCSSSSSSFFR